MFNSDYWQMTQEKLLVIRLWTMALSLSSTSHLTPYQFHSRHLWACLCCILTGNRPADWGALPRHTCTIFLPTADKGRMKSKHPALKHSPLPLTVYVLLCLISCLPVYIDASISVTPDVLLHSQWQWGKKKSGGLPEIHPLCFLNPSLAHMIIITVIFTSPLLTLYFTVVCWRQRHSSLELGK